MSAKLNVDFSALEVGESVLVKAEEYPINQLRVVASHKGKALGRRFSVRKTADGATVTRVEVP